MLFIIALLFIFADASPLHINLRPDLKTSFNVPCYLTNGNRYTWSRVDSTITEFVFKGELLQTAIVESNGKSSIISTANIPSGCNIHSREIPQSSMESTAALKWYEMKVQGKSVVETFVYLQPGFPDKRFQIEHLADGTRQTIGVA